jgi:hypothetical protein
VANALYDYARNTNPRYPRLTLAEAKSLITDLRTLVEPVDEDDAT